LPKQKKSKNPKRMLNNKLEIKKNERNLNQGDKDKERLNITGIEEM